MGEKDLSVNLCVLPVPPTVQSQATRQLVTYTDSVVPEVGCVHLRARDDSNEDLLFCSNKLLEEPSKMNCLKLTVERGRSYMN